MDRRRWAALAFVLALSSGLGACGGTSGGVSNGVVHVVAAENFWGDIAAQLGGAHVKVTSIIHDPSADPHQYESDPRDAAAVAGAAIVIVNGLGYDDFMQKLLSATSNHGRSVVTVAKVLGVSGADANPHLWYDIPRVKSVAQSLADTLAASDPRDRATFTQNLATFDASLAPLLDLIDEIRMRNPGAPVAYTERVPGYLLADAGLTVKTPGGFAQAIEDGNEPSAGDTSAMESLITEHRIRVLLYNAQATSPITQQVRALADHDGVPVVGVTETIVPSTAHYQQWQLGQLQQLAGALGG